MVCSCASPDWSEVLQGMFVTAEWTSVGPMAIIPTDGSCFVLSAWSSWKRNSLKQQHMEVFPIGETDDPKDIKMRTCQGQLYLSHCSGSLSGRLATEEAGRGLNSLLRESGGRL